jgi:ribonuclease HI
MNTEWVIYTDGSCMPTSVNGYGAWCCIVLSPSGEKKVLSGTEYPTTNNRMEMSAILEGIKVTPKDAEVLVYSDSQYAVNTFSRWYWNWVKKPIQLAKKKNLDIIGKVTGEMLQRKVALEWVRGHNGNELNEECDRICNSLAYNLYDDSRKRNHSVARKYEYLKNYNQSSV